MAERKQKRLLVIFPGALGDMICALPAIRLIAERHPDAALEIMARAELARFAVGRLGAVHAHPLDRRETGHLFVPSIDLKAARSFFGGFDHVHSFFAANNQDFRARLALAAGGPVGFVPFRPSGEGHIAARYLREAGDMAASEERAETLSRIEVLPEDLEAADEQLAAIRRQASGFWLIFPGSGSPSKNWPVADFLDLAGMLAPGTRPIIGFCRKVLARTSMRLGGDGFIGPTSKTAAQA
jgi:ADP-heptose:LPS heptosyltransferase